MAPGGVAGSTAHRCSRDELAPTTVRNFPKLQAILDSVIGKFLLNLKAESLRSDVIDSVAFGIPELNGCNCAPYPHRIRMDQAVRAPKFDSLLQVRSEHQGLGRALR
jgi:hypothetical protein